MNIDGENMANTATRTKKTAQRKQAAGQALTHEPGPAKNLAGPSETPTLDFTVEAAHIVTVTPAAAEEWLERNTHNRALMSRNVTQIAEDITRGDYRFSGDTIVFSNEGVLLDGQHRLAAIVKAGKPLKVVAVTGVESAVQANMDSGKTRTLPHALKLQGEVAEASLAAALIAVQAWERGERNHDGNRMSVTKSTSLRFLDENPALRDIVREAGNIAPRIPGLTTKQVSLLIWVFDKLSVDDRKDFFDKLVTGAGLTKGDPILVLRNFLTKDATSETRVSPYHRLGLTVKAWNSYRKGQTGTALRFRPGGARPEEFPEPV